MLYQNTMSARKETAFTLSLADIHAIGTELLHFTMALTKRQKRTKI